MPSSLQARMIRKAISPRLAMRIRLNISAARVDLEQRLVELDRFTVLAEDGGDLAADFGGNLVEDLHRFNDANDRRGIDAIADFDERLGLGIGPRVERANHRALDDRDVRALGRRRLGRRSGASRRSRRQWGGRRRWWCIRPTRWLLRHPANPDPLP